jgi:hypothetical protein
MRCEKADCSSTSSPPLNRKAVHAWMHAVGMINDHEPRCFRHAEVRGQARLRPT